ncbi:MAG: type II toxin-antitoxin system Phd/YefM family antitoxin [Terracidiphilus sp.]
MKTMTSVEAQNNFGRLLDSAQRETVMVTRHGRPAVFVVSPRDMDDLMESRIGRSRAVADPEAPQTQAATRTDEVQKLAVDPLTDDEDLSSPVDELG